MGDCVYCGKPAGFLKKEHKECRQAVDSGDKSMVALVSSTIAQDRPFESLDHELRQIATDHFIDPSSAAKYLARGWEAAVEVLLDDGVLTEGEEAKLMAFGEHFNLAQHDLDLHGAYTQVVHAAVLRDIMDGKVPQRLKLQADLPFNLQKTEQLVWVFSDTAYYEDKTRREFVGGSQGASVRVAKGVYLRTSSFKGHPVERTETLHVDNGALGVTTKHLYFSGGRKSLRIPYTKIISFDPYSDGLGVHRDAASAKPQRFITGYGWFTYNLVTNLAQM